MLLLRILKKSAIDDWFITSTNFRSFNRISNGRNIKVRPKIQPPSVPSYVGTENLNFRCLVKPFIFTACFSSGTFACCAIWQYEDMRKKAFRKLLPWFDMEYSPTYKKGQIRRELNNWWMTQSQGQKVALTIAAINLSVFLFWKVQPLRPFMQKYFCSSPANKAVCLPMFLSTFSHYSFFHLAANMFVLYSFSNTSVAYLGREQFVAVYCSAGVISSFASYVHKIFTRSYGPSLGASGAILTILSSYCLQFPDSRLAIIFLPFFTIPAVHALKGIIALDTIGIFAKWQIFDHAAHLGGSLFGLFYYYYGCQRIWGNREYIIHRWHDFRTENKND